MRKLVILAALAASLSVAACNTVEGAGKDVSSAGRDRHGQGRQEQLTFAKRRSQRPAGNGGPFSFCHVRSISGAKSRCVGQRYA